jgi:hypothetical protein
MRPALHALTVTVALAAACNPYDPQLGDTPFRCGTDEPRCPDGYLPVQISTPICECRRAALLPDAGRGYFCNFDPSDTADMRNDTPANAAILDAETNPVFTLIDRAICPLGDEDHYALNAPRVGTRIFFRVTYDRTRLSPGLDITNHEGASIMPIRAEPDPGVVTAEHTTTFAGVYVLKVISAEEVNYSLRYEITPP